jgi:hypothetical protein
MIRHVGREAHRKGEVSIRFRPPAGGQRQNTFALDESGRMRSSGGSAGCRATPSSCLDDLEERRLLPRLPAGLCINGPRGPARSLFHETGLFACPSGADGGERALTA